MSDPAVYIDPYDMPPAPAEPLRTIEELARILCKASGVDPDRPVIMGAPELLAGMSGYYVGPLGAYGPHIAPGWVHFISSAVTMGFPVKMRGKYRHWISENSVVSFKLVPQTLELNAESSA